MRIAALPLVGFDVHIRINKEYLYLRYSQAHVKPQSDVSKNNIKTLKSPIVLLIAFFAT